MAFTHSVEEKDNEKFTSFFSAFPTGSQQRITDDQLAKEDSKALRARRERLRMAELRRASQQLARKLPDAEPSCGRLSDRKTYFAAIQYIKVLRDTLADTILREFVVEANKRKWSDQKQKQYLENHRQENQMKLNRVAQKIMSQRVRHPRPTGTKLSAGKNRTQQRRDRRGRLLTPSKAS